MLATCNILASPSRPIKLARAAADLDAPRPPGNVAAMPPPPRPPDSAPPRTPSVPDRADRKPDPRRAALAAALRENLRKRKAQARVRAAPAAIPRADPS
jgi:hypothetical protein